MTPEPTTFMGVLKAFFEVVHSIWKNGARLLWACSIAAVAAFIVLHYADRWGAGGAAELDRDYGVYLLLTAAILGVFAGFKTYSERQARPLILIADERRSFWGQAKQNSGAVITTIAIDLQVTNVSDGTVQISGARLSWPWVSRRAILDTVILVEGPQSSTHSGRNPVLPHSLRHATIHFVIGRPVGRPGKPMCVMIRVQDHARNWYWLAIRYVRSGPVAPERAVS